MVFLNINVFLLLRKGLFSKANFKTTLCIAEYKKSLTRKRLARLFDNRVMFRFNP
jgi:hypothetical protein